MDQSELMDDDFCIDHDEDVHQNCAAEAIVPCCSDTDNVVDHELPFVYNLAKCLLCSSDTADDVPQILSEVGLDSFVRNCKTVGLRHLAEYVLSHGLGEIMLHRRCRNRLTKSANKTVIDSEVDQNNNSTRTRSSKGSFDFRTLCLYCTEPVVASSDLRKVSTLEFDYNLRKVIKERSFDIWAMEVQGRLETICDLHASDAVYHLDCHVRFTKNLPLKKQQVKRGRPVNHDAVSAFDKLCDKIEADGENELYTLSQLHSMMLSLSNGEDEKMLYTKEYLRELLRKRYPDTVYFASRAGREDVVGFTNMCDLIIRDKFISDHIEGEGTVAEKLVRKAAALVLAEIREAEFERKLYPSPDEISGDGLQVVPSLLRIFLQRLLSNPLKQAALGQAVVQACKPNSCIMPLLFGVGVEMSRCGEKQLHDKLAHLGFSLSYSECRRFKQSVVQCYPSVDHEISSEVGEFTQFVGDNFDHNIKTLDGHGTFHGMGIISATVRQQSTLQKSNHRVPRLKLRKAGDATSIRRVRIASFNMCSDASKLTELKLNSIMALKQPFILPRTINLMHLWHIGGLLSPDNHPRPNWSGYMQKVCVGEHPGVSCVEMLSLIDLNPSDQDCIYSTLLFIHDQATALGLPTACITFDQPLYIKAVDIVMQSKLNIVVRLGGFHTLMNFLGSVGYIMKGSGLEELLGLLYGSNTMELVLSGKAYARALRGHFLIDTALTEILLNYLKTASQQDDNEPAVVVSDTEAAKSLAGTLSASVMSELEAIYEEVMQEGKADINKSDGFQSDSLLYFTQQLQNLKHALHNQSRTARLWLLYMQYIGTVRKYIIADRTGDWLLHLDTLESMLSLFAASGHNNYAKSARIYLQQMRQLSETCPWLDGQLRAGNSAIWRSDRMWAGLPPDLVIEQTMMRSGKSPGGLTHGRGMTESVRIAWLSSVTEYASVHAAMSKVTRTDERTVEHVECSVSRMKRDLCDLKKIELYLSQYSPFGNSDNERLISLSSSVTAGKDDGVNCDQAESLGFALQQHWDNQKYGSLVLRKADKVVPLANVVDSTQNSVKVAINTSSLFHRLVLVGERTGTVRDCFSYELTPYPMSLFKDELMRKPNKPDLCKSFIEGLTAEMLPSGVLTVVDGGYMLHKVRWNVPSHMADILPLFAQYLRTFGQSVQVVFDGYGNEPSIKDHEHFRRSAKVGTVAMTRQVDERTREIGPQEAFLANIENKRAFIGVLSKYLTKSGFNVHQSSGDADTDIVSKALTCACSTSSPVAVIAEDTDILVLLLHHRTGLMPEVYFVSQPKRGKGGKVIDGKSISISQVQKILGTEACQLMPVVHAFGGCDSTSAVFGLGKGAMLKRIQGNEKLQGLCSTLQSKRATEAEVRYAGQHLMAILYGGTQSDTLSALRYTRYCTMSLGRRFRPESLPPTDSAAHLHAMRVHYQSVFWATLGSTDLKPTDWGWSLNRGKLVPTQFEGEVAPENMLKLVRCGCTGSCASVSCSCRKHGLQCVSACRNCHGTECTNFKIDMGIDADIADEDDDLNPDLPEIFWEDEAHVNLLYEEEV